MHAVPTPSPSPKTPSAGRMPVAAPVAPIVTPAPNPSPFAPPPQPAAQPWGGWGAPPPPAPFGGYAPGSRVHVTWSNGQRYPATIQQVAGGQCLVVFPDGQQHWVALQYVSPG
jgi:hypothetical protein